MKLWIMVAALVVISPMWALAGKGNQSPAPKGPAPKNKMVQGTPFTYEGVVVECLNGDGLVLLVDDGSGETFPVVIRGLGPDRYWDMKEMEKPDVEDKIRVTGYKKTYDGLEINIAFAVTFMIEGEEWPTIQLRDPDTGLPLWRMALVKKMLRRCWQ